MKPLSRAKPPKLLKFPKLLTAHGDCRSDDYFWLRDRDDPAVMAHLEAENAYAQSCLEATEALRAEIYREMLSRIKEDDMDVPEFWHGYYYYSRTEKGREYEIYCRRKGTPGAPEQIILDLNELAAGQEYTELGQQALSPSHDLLAYTLDTDGGEIYTLRIKDLRSGGMLADEIGDVDDGIEWANDNSTLFYIRVDDSQRPCQLWRHRLGESGDNDQLVFEEHDPAFYLTVSKSRDDAYLFIELCSNDTSEVHYLDADHPFQAFKCLQPRRPGIEYDVDHHDGFFYLRTNLLGRDYCLMRTPVARPRQQNWQVVQAHCPGRTLLDFMTFKDYLVLYEREQAQVRIRFGSYQGPWRRIDFDQPVHHLELDSNPQFDAGMLRFSYESPVDAPIIYDFNMSDCGLTLLKQTPVPNYDPARYRCERLFVQARDGARIPVTVLRRAGEPDGNTPLLIYGYGAYGLTVDPCFSPEIFSLVDRGVNYAVAHVRGGRMMGDDWYQQGRLRLKKNSFHDFIDATEALLQRGYGHQDKVAMWGASAGGLLVAAVMNMRPELYKAVVAQVPFVDVVTTLEDKQLRFSVLEYQEWGDPAHKADYDYIRSYSPYDNVRDANYPHVFVSTAINDSRVNYWEPAKWVARLRDHQLSGAPILLYTHLGAGHGGPSGRYESLQDEAREYAFLLSKLA